MPGTGARHHANASAGFAGYRPSSRLRRSPISLWHVGELQLLRQVVSQVVSGVLSPCGQGALPVSYSQPSNNPMRRHCSLRTCGASWRKVHPIHDPIMLLTMLLQEANFFSLQVAVAVAVLPRSAPPPRPLLLHRDGSGDTQAASAWTLDHDHAVPPQLPARNATALDCGRAWWCQQPPLGASRG